jgi:hypothetical protein
MMFYGARIKDDCFYFIKTLSENKIIPNFIDEMDSNPSSYSMMPAWEDDGKVLKKEIFKSNKSDNSRVYQKCLYIINSIDSGIRYCLNLFCENSSFNSFEMSSLTIHKISSPNGKNIHDLLEKRDNNTYFAYMFINNEPNKIRVTFNSNGQAFTLEEASIFVVKNNENINIEYDSDAPLYFAKANVIFDNQNSSGTDE